MAIGEAIGYFIPVASGFVKPFSCGTINIPLADGLMWMMYPPLAKERFEKMEEMFKRTKILWPSLSLNWIPVTILMFVLILSFCGTILFNWHQDLILYP